MVDDITGQGSGEEAPAPEQEQPQDQAPAEAPRMYKVGDEEISEHELVNRALNFNRKITEMGQSNAQLKKELENYKTWADPLVENYHSNPAYREGLDELHRNVYGDAGTTRQNVPSPELRQLQQQAVELEALKQAQAFNNLRANGVDISLQDEASVRNLMATDPRFTDVEVAYRYLYYERDQRAAADKATTRTAEEMAKGQQAYTTPAKGTSSRSPSKDPSEMTPHQLEAEVTQKLREAGFGD